jgi:hypothetical protein
MGNPGPKEGVVNSVDDAREAVRQRYKTEPIGLKYATGGVLSVAKVGVTPVYRERNRSNRKYSQRLWNASSSNAHGDERAIIGGVKR